MLSAQKRTVERTSLHLLKTITAEKEAHRSRRPLTETIQTMMITMTMMNHGVRTQITDNGGKKAKKKSLTQTKKFPPSRAIQMEK